MKRDNETEDTADPLTRTKPLVFIAFSPLFLSLSCQSAHVPSELAAVSQDVSSKLGTLEVRTEKRVTDKQIEHESGEGPLLRAKSQDHPLDDSNEFRERR